MPANWLAGAAKGAATVAILVAVGEVPTSLGDFVAYALALALPVAAIVRHAKVGPRAGKAYVALSLAATLALAYLASSLFGDCGGDGLGCEAAFLIGAPVYLVLEIAALIASRAKKPSL